ncbi:PREDICTED: PHD finger protein ING1-like [Priapulus caudatus]|uniref:PHD finger protein ING1-like n=1 Tax=Priapulus caudatus TaxID=37621 RepID=A0ABM1F933_PRICU|nr:PREDICTED: PHD finger protein ING1-like [Priapulus caudatus]
MNVFQDSDFSAATLTDMSEDVPRDAPPPTNNNSNMKASRTDPQPSEQQEEGRKGDINQVPGPNRQQANMISDGKPQSPVNTATANDADLSYCYCGQPEDADDMIACDNHNCKVQWYHIGCLKIKRVPKDVID